MGKNKEEWTLPTQTRGIIFGVCLCQMTIVLSIVSFIYLSVAIYMPAYRAFNSGFDTVPVTCETLEMNLINNCSWASCGEWCLTKTSGFCPQITVRTRQNGTDLILENCSRLSTNSCPQVNLESFKRYNCNHGSQCAALTGLFNCTLGHCANMSEQLQCNYKADGIILDPDKDNMKLNGLFDCENARCKKVTKYFGCDRKFCPKITTVGVNTFLMYEDSLYTGDCQRALAQTKNRGKYAPEKIPPQEIWTEEKTKGYLLASCGKVERTGTNSLVASDCINGTVLPESKMPIPYVNFTVFWSVYDNSKSELDPKGEFLPWQKNLTIHETSKLHVNIEGCVWNTLRNECKKFAQFYGRDGRNRTAYSRFLCFHKPNDSSKSIIFFDLKETRLQLLVSIVVPSVLFVISCFTLTVVTKFVKIDNKSMLRCAVFGLQRVGKKSEEEIQLELSNY